jgi:hypothetical protein
MLSFAARGGSDCPSMGARERRILYCSYFSTICGVRTVRRPGRAPDHEGHDVGARGPSTDPVRLGLARGAYDRPGEVSLGGAIEPYR